MGADMLDRHQVLASVGVVLQFLAGAVFVAELSAHCRAPSEADAAAAPDAGLRIAAAPDLVVIGTDGRVMVFDRAVALEHFALGIPADPTD